MGFFDFFRKGNKEDAQPAVEGTTGATAIENAEEAAADTEAENAAEEQTAEAPAEDAQAGESDAPAGNASGNAGPAPQKFTPEQIAARKAKQNELTQKRDSEGMVLSYLIQRHHEISTVDSFKSVLESLQTCWLWVPMRMQVSKTDAVNMQVARQQGKKYSPKDPVKLVPSLIKTKDGQLVYSSFTNRDEIPKELTKQFIWVQVPSGQCAQAVVTAPNISAMVINPNSKSLLLKKELLQKLVKPVKTPEQQQAQDLASEPDTSGFTS